jgi:Fe-S cluster biogenesis protein NfuA
MQDDAQETHPAGRIERLLHEVETFPDAHVRAVAEELLRSLLSLYGEGLARMLELIAQTEERGERLISRLASDELVGALLMLHDLHPVTLEERVARALAEVRPYLHSHGGDVALLRVEEGIAYLRLEGSCHGCPASLYTLKQRIEEEVYRAAPDLVRLEVEGVNEQPSRSSASVPLVFIPRRRSGLAGEAGVAPELKA